MKYLKSSLPFLFVLLLTIISIVPFFHSGFFPIHDNTQVQRIFEMTKSLKDGMFPVRWVADLGFGYGYPIFNFYAPLAYYLGSIINLVGFDTLLSTKIMMALGILLSGISMYLFANKLWGKQGGVLSALLYVFAPFHAVDIYVRGDVAEFWAYALVPLVFYGLLGIHKTQKYRFVLITAISYALLIVSHNLTGLMATPFILLFALLLYFGDKKKGIRLLFPLLSGVLLSAFYWFPALLETSYTNVFSQIGGGADFRDHFVCLSQLWSSPWGFGGSVKGCVDGLSFMIGKLHIMFYLVSIVFLAIIWKFKKGDKQKLALIVILSVLLLFSIFLTLDISRFFWNLLPPMAFFQYPWRFLLMVSFLISVIAGSVGLYLETFSKKRVVLLLIFTGLSVFIVGFNTKYFIAQKYLFVTSNNYINDYMLKFKTSQITSEYMPKSFQKPANADNLPSFDNLSNNDISVRVISKKTQQISLAINVFKNGYYIFPIAYFPAWKAYLDFKETKLSPSTRGVGLSLPIGSHSLRFIYVQTPIEVVSDLLSLAGILVLVLGIILKKKDL